MTCDEDLFAAALAVANPKDREAYLQRECAGDPSRYERLAGLLRHHDAAGGFLTEALGLRSALTSGQASIGRIGHYRLVETLGEGGVGVVYRAEQEQPVRRQVALKLIKPGMDTHEVIARFESERQALALMDHPFIARVFDAGTTTAGRPYFVMELVDGVPLTHYCDQQRLDVPARLELFAGVCQAVQHAHQKGIIHRDLKPSNILVASHGDVRLPKIIDFGIAKATAGGLPDHTQHTVRDSLIGTPAYMSPEQAEARRADVDTRSDVYSLGVILHELLVGRTPFDSARFRDVPVEEIRRQICTVEPLRPSQHFRVLASTERSALAERRQTTPLQLGHALRGDLDWIVARCLEKDRARRYPTANGLALDLQRHLQREPVSARPPSLPYLLQRLIRRHLVGFSAFAAVLGAVVIGAIGFATQAARALRAEREQGALREAARQAVVREALAKVAAEEERQRATRQRWARQYLLPEIRRLLDRVEPAAAFDRAIEAEKLLGDDPELADLLRRVAVTTPVRSNPPGAEVLVKPYLDPTGEWRRLGTTPLETVRLAGRALYRWEVRKKGYLTLERATLPGLQGEFILVPAAEAPSGMVPIPGERRHVIEENPNLLAPPPPPTRAAPLEPYFIDRYEVTHRQFQEFADAGGYADPRWWRAPFLQAGRELSWPEAMTHLRDSTGRPGPSTWADGRHPPGLADHPVGGVSWFEAAAYAAWAGKRLPALRHWLRAASSWPEPTVQLSNFSGQDPAPGGRYAGMSAWGVYDVAGNVKEWCWTEAAPGTRYLMGGGSREPAYMFRQDDALSPWDRSAANGFRCIRLAPGATCPPEIDAAVLPRRRDYSLDRSASEDVYRVLRAQYAYVKGPLNAQVETVHETSFDWRVERATLDTAYGTARLPVLLFLPRNRPPPHPTVVYYPSSDAFSNRSGTPATRLLQFVVGSGRAVVFPIYDGTHERSEGPRARYLDDTNLYTDFVVHSSKDLGRTIDYLETRSDLRLDTLAFWGMSLGGSVGVVLVALEPRIKLCALISGGINPREVPPHVDQVNFAPRITCPTLMVNGRYDFIFPLPAQQQLHRLLGTPAEHKRHVIYERGHIVRGDELQAELLAWLDRYQGPVR